MASTKHAHLDLLVKSDKVYKTKDGLDVEVYQLNLKGATEEVVSNWAKHFRQQYCLDEKIDELIAGTGMTRKKFLQEIVFPSGTTKLGPAVRSGDFAEILLADVLEHVESYWTPRTRYSSKAVADESTKGSDVLGLKFVNSPEQWEPDDVLFIGESKAQMSGTKPKARLQDSVNDSSKDSLRKSQSLHAAKRKLLEEGRNDDALRVQRFQDPLSRPHAEQYGAVAILSSEYLSEDVIADTTCELHANKGQLRLLVLHAKDLMAFVHSLYERAAHEA